MSTNPGTSVTTTTTTRPEPNRPTSVSLQEWMQEPDDMFVGPQTERLSLMWKLMSARTLQWFEPIHGINGESSVGRLLNRILTVKHWSDIPALFASAVDLPTEAQMASYFAENTKFLDARDTPLGTFQRLMEWGYSWKKELEQGRSGGEPGSVDQSSTAVENSNTKEGSNGGSSWVLPLRPGA